MEYGEPEGIIEILREILTLSREIENALAAADVEGFERALAARAEALARLAPVSAKGRALPARTATGNADGDETLRAVADELREIEARNHELSHALLVRFHGQLRSMDHGQRALAGYRPPSSREPRFTNRKG